MTTEERMTIVFEALGACYWCAQLGCDDHQVAVAQKIVTHWEDELRKAK